MNNVRYYTPGNNANIVTLRREENFDPNGNAGNGETITDIERRVEDLYKMAISFGDMYRALETIAMRKLPDGERITSPVCMANIAGNTLKKVNALTPEQRTILETLEQPQ